MVVWRVRELGYTDELFNEIDVALSKQEYERYRYNKSYASAPYRKKYRDIAFYELYGHNIIKKLSLDFKDEDGFRVSPYYIDPTFPSIPSKKQLITCCLLPRKAEEIQKWVSRDATSYLESHYIRADIGEDNSEWVMLRGYIAQEGGEDRSRIDISLYTINHHGFSNCRCI